MVRCSIVCVLALAPCVHAADPMCDGLHPLACMDEPIVHIRASIPVDVGWAIVDIDEVDEAGQVIIVKQFMQMTWEDERWKKAFEWFCLQPGSNAKPIYKATCLLPEERRPLAWFDFLTNRTANRYPLFMKKARAMANLLGADHPPDVTPWVPFAMNQLPKAGENLAGVTAVTPYIFPVGLTEFTAFWPDTGRTTFDITFKYTHFPFDKQNFTMCIDLVHHAMPSEVLTFRARSQSISFSELSSVLINPYESSSFSPRVSKATVEAFRSKGFGVLSVTPEIRLKGVSQEMCMTIELRRIENNFYFRFLLPLNFLLCTSFAGFWLPIGQAMPRIATGFVSFLSLAVFRTMAYAMVPRPNYGFMWIDALMLSATEIMFLAVMANIGSQVVNDQSGPSASKYADKMLRVAFPLVGLFTQVLLVGLGREHTDPEYIFAAVQVELVLAIVIVTILQYRFLKYLPHRLLHNYVAKMTNRQSLVGADAKVDHWEMGQIFALMDKNFDGLITASHILLTLEEHGLGMTCDEERDDFRVGIVRVCEIAKAKHDIHDTDCEEPVIGYDGFLEHFKDLFCRKAVRKRLTDLAQIQNYDANDDDVAPTVRSAKPGLRQLESRVKKWEV